MGEANRENVSDEAQGRGEMGGSKKNNNNNNNKEKKKQTYWKMQPSIIIFPKRGSIGSLARR